MSLARHTARQIVRSLPTTQRVTFSLSHRTMAEGDTGGSRSGGAAQGDAFTKREKANEDYYVREQEKQKLEALKKKIADGEAQLAQDRKDAEALGKK